MCGDPMQLRVRIGRWSRGRAQAEAGTDVLWLSDIHIDMLGDLVWYSSAGQNMDGGKDWGIMTIGNNYARLDLLRGEELVAGRSWMQDYTKVDVSFLLHVVPAFISSRRPQGHAAATHQRSLPFPTFQGRVKSSERLGLKC